MVACIRRLYKKTPVYLLCDKTVKEVVQKAGFNNIEYDLSAEQEGLDKVNAEFNDVLVHNDFHRIDCIALKMDCLERAIENYGNTMFLDCDIIPLKPFDRDIESCRHGVILSPHYHWGPGRAKNARIYGIFNAGYLWSNTDTLAEVWRNIYKERSTFYEQQGMVWIMDHFDVGMFDDRHNVGFWRFEMRFLIKEYRTVREIAIPTDWEWSQVKSIHGHVTENYAKSANKGLCEAYDRYREIILDVLEIEAPELLEYL